MPGLDTAMSPEGQARTDEVRRLMGDEVADYVCGEAKTSQILAFETRVFPGSLQLEPWAAALLGQFDTDTARVLTKAQLRARRAASLENHVMRVVLLRELFERPVGGWQTMFDQVKHVIEQSQLSTIKVRILDYEVGADPGIDGPFSVLVTGSGQAVSRRAHAEHALGYTWRFDDRGEDVAELAERFERLWSMAAEEGPSRDIMKMYLERYRERLPRQN